MDVDKLTPHEARQMAKQALACPFCQQRLVLKQDHLGCWVGHERDGSCWTVELLNQNDLIKWNKRSEK